jgi:hypothetical protein
MKPWKRTLLVGLAEIAVILILHAVLLRVMATRQIVSTLLAAGDHVPRLTLACAILFVVVRFLAVLALPGLILARVGMALAEWQHDRHEALHKS